MLFNDVVNDHSINDDDENNFDRKFEYFFLFGMNEHTPVIIIAAPPYKRLFNDIDTIIT